MGDIGPGGLSAGLSVPGVNQHQDGQGPAPNSPLPGYLPARCPSRTDIQGVAEAYLPLPEAAQKLQGGCPEEGPAQVLDASLISPALATGRGSPRCQDSGTMPSGHRQHSREHRASGHLTLPLPTSHSAPQCPAGAGVVMKEPFQRGPTCPALGSVSRECGSGTSQPTLVGKSSHLVSTYCMLGPMPGCQIPMTTK